MFCEVNNGEHCLKPWQVCWVHYKRPWPLQVAAETSNLRWLTSTTSLNLPSWSQRWVVSDDDPTYMFGRICPVSPEMSTQDILTNLTVLDETPTQVIDAFRLPAFVRDGQMMANMAICIKFKGHLPDRIALNSVMYCVRSHTLPVLRCTRCLLFGLGNISCSGKKHCGRCSGYHDAEACTRPRHVFSVVATTYLSIG